MKLVTLLALVLSISAFAHNTTKRTTMERKVREKASSCTTEKHGSCTAAEENTKCVYKKEVDGELKKFYSVCLKEGSGYEWWNGDFDPTSRPD